MRHVKIISFPETFKLSLQKTTNNSGSQTHVRIHFENTVMPSISKSFRLGSKVTAKRDGVVPKKLKIKGKDHDWER